MNKNIQIREAFAAGINADTRVDFTAGIVYGVRLLGKKSMNDKDYEPSAIQAAEQFVETRGSYIDHPPGEGNERSIRERFGVFKQPYYDPDGTLCAREFHYDKSNAFAPSFEWMLKHCPTDIGFSINAAAVGYEKNDGRVAVTDILECHGFDLVDRPATTGGIFSIRESYNKRHKAITIREARIAMFPEAFKMGIQELTAKIGDGSIDVAAAKKKMNDLFKLIAPEEAAAEAEMVVAEEAYDTAKEEEKPVKAMESANRSKYKWIRHLANRVDTFVVREQAEKQMKEKEQKTLARVKKAEEKFGDNKNLITATFREQLAGAKDDAEVDLLIADRLSVFNVRETTASGTRFEEPASRGSTAGDASVEALTKQYFN
jgi:hypothetical protein